VILNNEYILKRFIIFTHASAFNIKENIGKRVGKYRKKIYSKTYLFIYFSSVF